MGGSFTNNHPQADSVRECAECGGIESFWQSLRCDVRAFLNKSGYAQAYLAKVLKIGCGRMNQFVRGIQPLKRSDARRIARFIDPSGKLSKTVDSAFPSKPRRVTLRGARTFTLSEYARLAPTEVRS